MQKKKTTLKEKLLIYSSEISKCLSDAMVQISVNPCKDAEFKFNLLILTVLNFFIVSCKLNTLSKITNYLYN
jgi:hypothetical protein